MAHLPRAASVYWLEEALEIDPGAPCPALARRETADVCVVGGGYTGLWTAIEVKLRHPDVAVVLLEATGCGFGASGRNGGWVTGWHDELDNLLAHFSPNEALWLASESSKAIERIGSLSSEWGIDCQFRQRGALWAAAGPAQLDAWRPAVEACRQHGRGRFLEVLDGKEVRRRTGSPILLGAARQTDAAVVQPALLVRGLRRKALDLGVKIHEGTPMVALDRGRPARVQTPAGHVEAHHVVLAMNAWSATLPEVRRAFVVVGSHILLTEPIPEPLGDLPWRDGELLGDAQTSVHYAQVTRDGRIAFGRGLGEVSTRVIASHYVSPRVTANIFDDFKRFFPHLAGVSISHVWGGPVDRTPIHLPFAGSLEPDGNIHYGLGYSGNGVGPAALMGRILGALATESTDEYAASPLARGPLAYFPLEPLRTWGGRIVRRSVVAVDDARARGRSPNRLALRATALVGFHTPAILEPRLRTSPFIPG